MQDILRYINSVEGVIGSAVFGATGDVVEHAFPPLIDNNALKAAAVLVEECSHGLQISETLDTFDLRYNDGRIIIKAFRGAVLYLLCAKSINPQVLNITLNLAIKKLEAMVPAPSEPALPAEAAAAAAVAAPAMTESADGILRLQISHLANREASSSFDSLGMIAVSQPTSSYISEFYKNPFKKLMLNNTATGTTGTFPVMIMKDMDPRYDGTIIVGPGIEKKLKVNEGDKVEVRIG